MATDKQIAANRRNAQKATGPKSAEGKFKSSLNALRLGLYSHTFVIKAEDEQVFQNFSAVFIDEFKPQTPSELELLEQLIITAWCRRRLAGLINQRINNAIDNVSAQSVQTETAPETTPSIPPSSPSPPTKNSKTKSPLSPARKLKKRASVPSSNAPSPASSNPAKTPSNKKSGTKPIST